MNERIADASDAAGLNQGFVARPFDQIQVATSLITFSFAVKKTMTIARYVFIWRILDKLDFSANPWG